MLVSLDDADPAALSIGRPAAADTVGQPAHPRNNGIRLLQVDGVACGVILEASTHVVCAQM
jgi:hypothetical protein